MRRPGLSASFTKAAPKYSVLLKKHNTLRIKCVGRDSNPDNRLSSLKESKRTLSMWKAGVLTIGPPTRSVKMNLALV